MGRFKEIVGIIVNKILEIRALICSYFHRFHSIITPIIRFLFAFVTFTVINDKLGTDPKLTSTTVKLLMSAASAFIPMILFVFVAVIMVLVHLYTIMPLIAVLALVVFLVLYCFAARFSGKMAYAVVAIPVLFELGMPELAPIFMGLVGGFMGIFPAACGVIGYYSITVFLNEANTVTITNVDDALKVYIDVVNKILSNKEMFAYVIIFSAIIVVMNIIKKASVRGIHEINILAGGVAYIIADVVIMSKFGITNDIGTVIGHVLLCILIMLVIQFFRLVTDNRKVVRTQFEDDEYYYFVKAVPKLDIAAADRVKKQLHLDDEQIEAEEEWTKAVMNGYNADTTFGGYPLTTNESGFVNTFSGAPIPQPVEAEDTSVSEIEPQTEASEDTITGEHTIQRG